MMPVIRNSPDVLNKQPLICLQLITSVSVLPGIDFKAAFFKSLVKRRRFIEVHTKLYNQQLQTDIKIKNPPDPPQNLMCVSVTH